MHVSKLELRGFRNFSKAALELSPGVTLIHGPNGAGKTNLIEAVHFALTGRSPRTRNLREMIGFESPLGRVEATLVSEGGEARELAASVARSGERRHELDGPASEPPPSASVFLPDHLELVKGPPGSRRRHLDRFIASLWPARGELRVRFGKALGQRNALLARIRAGQATAEALAAWDGEFAARALELIEARADAAARLEAPFRQAADELGLGSDSVVRYRPRSEARTVEELLAELEQHRPSDLARGYSGYGPHLDELELTLAGRSARRYASQGEQRMALLSLLFAERAAMLTAGCAPPPMLLDDVMSELDPERRDRLAARLEGSGQALITATEPEQVPAGHDHEEVAVSDGALLPAAVA